MYRISVKKKDDIVYISADEGELLLDVLIRGGIFIDAPCGGLGVCGKCRVYIEGNGEKLACREKVSGNMNIIVDSYDSEILTSGKMRDVDFKAQEGYGLAIDIGTTTIAVKLVDLKTGSVINSYAEINHQKRYGADVISRISYCLGNETGIAEMHKCIAEQLDFMIADIMYKNNLKYIEKAVIAGNTAMLHFLTCADVSGLAAVPFSPEFLESREMNSVELGFMERFPIVLIPSASAYIGADIVSAMLAVGMDKARKNTLLIDLGTNGEMVLFSDGKYYSCSTAAGPAFEGAHIKCGTGSVSGAVDHVKINDDVPQITTINKKASCGICGSGIVDVVAEFLKNGIIDKNGTFVENFKWKAYISDNSFKISRKVSIYQEDIREIQLAKAAISAGIDILIEEAGISVREVDRVYIAGGMGNYIDKENALYIGLFPEEFADKLEVCGNAALSGAVSVLLDEELLDTAEKLRSKIINIDLADYDGFEKKYIENMNFNYDCRQTHF